MFDQQPFKVKQTVGSAWNVDRDDVTKTKSALQQTGDYKPPEWGITEFPDAAMFEGLKTFQKREGLEADGVMKPGGPTEQRLGQRVAAKTPARSKPAATPATPQTPAENLQAGMAKSPAATPQQPKAARGIVEGEWDWQRSSQDEGLGTGPTDPIDADIGLPPSNKDDAARDRSDETEVAFAPLIPLIAAGAPLVARYGPQAVQALRGAMRTAPPLIGAGDHARRQMRRHGQDADRPGDYPTPVPQPPKDEARSKDRSHRVAIDPPPPTPGLKPPDEKFPDRTESPAEPVELHTLSGLLPDVEESTIYVLPIPDDDLRRAGTVLENRRGKPATIAEIEDIQGRIEKEHPDLTHIGGGVDREKGRLKKEFWIPSPARSFGGDGRKGGTFIDLSFRTSTGKIVHVQTVTIDPKTGKVTQSELDAADRARRAHKKVDVILIPKGEEVDKYSSRSKRN